MTPWLISKSNLHYPPLILPFYLTDACPMMFPKGGGGTPQAASCLLGDYVKFSHSLQPSKSDNGCPAHAHDVHDISACPTTQNPFVVQCPF
jgi:hypothetical protein